MEIYNYTVAFNRQKYERDYTYNNEVMITLTCENYIVELPRNKAIEQIINKQIRSDTQDFLKYAEEVLLPQAIEEYKLSLSEQNPFHKYETILKYEITYNEKCYLSMFRDQYEFTGGAHGNTIRCANTWNLNSGRMVSIENYFENDFDYRIFLIEQIDALADQAIYNNPGIYFENYHALIREYFSARDYYLSLEGLVIFYQQYDLGPYSSGIITFTIPYTLIDRPPGCRHP